jgi:hypothetical protein
MRRGSIAHVCVCAIHSRVRSSEDKKKQKEHTHTQQYTTTHEWYPSREIHRAKLSLPDL